MSGLAAVRDQSGLIMLGEPGEPLQFSPFDTWRAFPWDVWYRESAVAGFADFSLRSWAFIPRYSERDSTQPGGSIPINPNAPGQDWVRGDVGIWYGRSSSTVTTWARPRLVLRTAPSSVWVLGDIDSVSILQLSVATGGTPTLPQPFPAPSADHAPPIGRAPLLPQPRRWWKRR